MTKSSSYRIPLLFLFVLEATILGGAAAIFGFVERVKVAQPEWIWCAPRASNGDTCSVSLRFSLQDSVSDATLRVSATGPVRALLDGTPVGSTSSAGGQAEFVLRDLTEGSHELAIEATHGSGTPGICAFVDLPPEASTRPRLGTDASWGGKDANGSGMASIIGPYSAGPFPKPFGDIPGSAMVLPGLRFWTTLALLMTAMVVTCLAGPILRPAQKSEHGALPIDLAIVFPSILYGSAAFLITALAASSISTGMIVALHVGSTAMFVLLLVGWKEGAQHIDRDQMLHRAEVSGYDSLCEASELMRLDLGKMNPEMRRTLQAPVDELADAIRFASTGMSAPELDTAIMGSMASLRAAMHGGHDAATITSRIRSVVDMIREREIRLRAERRA